jgi:hypothetical protein
MQEGRTKLKPRLLVAAGDGRLLPMAQKQLHRPQEIMVFIGGALGQITKCTCFAGDMSDVFGIDTAVIAGFDKNAVIEKVVQGPPDIEGKWNLCTVIMAFFPLQWKPLMYQVVPLAKIADYPSRKEVHMPRDNVRLPSFCTCNTNLYLCSARSNRTNIFIGTIHLYQVLNLHLFRF